MKDRLSWTRTKEPVPFEWWECAKCQKRYVRRPETCSDCGSRRFRERHKVKVPEFIRHEWVHPREEQGGAKS